MTLYFGSFDNNILVRYTNFYKVCSPNLYFPSSIFFFYKDIITKPDLPSVVSPPSLPITNCEATFFETHLTKFTFSTIVQFTFSFFHTFPIRIITEKSLPFASFLYSSPSNGTQPWRLHPLSVRVAPTCSSRKFSQSTPTISLNPENTQTGTRW